MNGPYILAIDQGTTGSRAIVFDGHARAVAQAYREIVQHYPRPGWVEHDPDELWTSVMDCIQDVLQQVPEAPANLAAIGITNQRETTVVWDRQTGRPVHPAIVWQCRRTAERCDQLRADPSVEAAIREKTGLLPDPYFSATKLEWLLDRVLGARRQAEEGRLAFGTVDSWLLWNLTGGRVHATDVTNASRTLLFHIDRMEWDPELLDLFRIPPSMLPRVVPNIGVMGHTAELGRLPAGVPIAGMAGDQQAALFGQACFSPGMVKNTYGTGCFVLMPTGDRPVLSRSGLLTTVAWATGSQKLYALEGSVFVAGAAVQWLRDGLGIITGAAEVEPLARQVDDAGGVYFVPAFAGLGAPYWDMYARGTIVGLTGATRKAHIVRAALESIAYQTRDVMERMGQEAGVALTELRADGGAAQNDLLLQFQADVLGIPVRRPEFLETTALGAAYMAGLGVGLWPDMENISRRWRMERLFEPRMDSATRSRLLAGWARAVERARGWAQAGPV